MGNTGMARERILIIDDDSFVRRSMVRVLSRMYDTVDVASAEQALELLSHDSKFDAILCDYNLSSLLSGREFYLRMVERRPDLARRTIIVSGGIPAEDLFEDRTHEHWLAKPFNPTAVVSMIDRLRTPTIGQVA